GLVCLVFGLYDGVLGDLLFDLDGHGALSCVGAVGALGSVRLVVFLSRLEAAPTGFVLWLSFRSGYDGLLRYPLSPTLSREGEGSFILFMLRRSLKSLPDPPFGKGRGFRSFHRRGGIWKSLPDPPFGKERGFRSFHRRGGFLNPSPALPLEKGGQSVA